MERTILLKENFSWMQIRKVILLNYQNNYVESFKPITRLSKFFAALLTIFKVPTKLF